MGTALIIAALAAAFTLGVLAQPVIARRFRKPPAYQPPLHADLLLQSGVTLDLIRYHRDTRIVVAKVVLTDVTRSVDGTTARFEDFFRWKDRNRIDHAGWGDE